MTTELPRPGALADWDRLAELHEGARNATSAERRVLVERLRAAEPSLAAELEAMLEATPTAAGLEIERRLGPTDSSPSLVARTRLGPWQIVRFLARGGMGEVYLAERADGAFTQQVAVKLLRPGIASADLMERFRLERNLLARLEHPAIVPLLDAGTASDGRPYLALRYVEGRAITRYCDETGASPRRRAELLVELCRAVQFAHSNLVVHRDLKPSNILVSADGRVHLLDFGVAKLLSRRNDATQPTRSLELAPMTPQRAAPEQRRGDPVTTATDVWALGMLLHELLTGRLPGEPTGDPATHAPRPAPDLPRDLAAIVGQALSAEPTRRYSSAGELASDVERWLRGEPVRARPDSLRYRVGRFVARHRLAVTASAAAMLALAGSTAVSIARSQEASREREAASRAAGQSLAVVDLMVDLFAGLDPIAGADLDTVRVSDLIAKGTTKAERLSDQPDVQARLRHVLGRIQLERSAWASALPLLQQARDAESARLAADDPALVPLQLDYARALHMTGNRAEAAAEADSALARIERLPAPPPLLLASALGTAGELSMGAEGERRLERALSILRATPAAPPLEIAANLTALAWCRRARDRPEEARELFREALDILRSERGDDHLLTLGLRSNLASMLDDPAERAREHEAILARRRAKLGEHHYMIANSWSALAAAKADSGEFAAAAAAYARAHAIWIETDKPENPMALAALRNEARAHERAGQSAHARASWGRLATDLSGARGSPRVLAGYHVELALYLLRVRQPSRAERESDRALALLELSHEPAPATAARAKVARGRARLAQSPGEDARAILATALAELEASAGDYVEEAAAARRALGLGASRLEVSGSAPGTRPRPMHATANP